MCLFIRTSDNDFVIHFYVLLNIRLNRSLFASFLERSFNDIFGFYKVVGGNILNEFL